MKEFIGINFNISSCKPAMFFFTGVYKKKFTKILRESPDGCFRIKIFLFKYLN